MCAAIKKPRRGGENGIGALDWNKSEPTNPIYIIAQFLYENSDPSLFKPSSYISKEDALKAKQIDYKM